MSRNPLCQCRVTHVIFRKLVSSSAVPLWLHRSGFSVLERDKLRESYLISQHRPLKALGFLFGGFRLFVCSCYPVYVFNILVLRQGFSQ